MSSENARHTDRAEYMFVDTQEAFESMLADLESHPIIAVDTEANNMFAYRENVTLIQFSTPNQDYILDPQSNVPIERLGPLFANPEIEKVFHAAEYDLIGLRRDFGFEVHHIFDTMHASRLLGKKRVGLAALLEEYFQVHLDKQYQRADWGKRPLPPEQLAYARLDTHYLIPLRHRLYEELVARDLWDLAQEDFQRLEHPPEPDRSFDPNGFWRLPDVHDLSPQALSVVRALYLWREEEARHRNVPPYKVLHNRELVYLARRMPRTMRDLGRMRGLKRLVDTEQGRQILRVIQEARRERPPSPPPLPPRAPYAYQRRMERLREWRRDTAQRLGVDSDIVLPRPAMERIAEANPQTQEELAALGVLGPARLRRYGPAIVAVLRRGT